MSYEVPLVYLLLTTKQPEEVCKILLGGGVFRCEGTKNEFELPTEIEPGQIFNVFEVKKGNRYDLAAPYYDEICVACQEAGLPNPKSRILLESDWLPDLLDLEESLALEAFKKVEPFAVYNLREGRIEPWLLEKIMAYRSCSK